VSRAGRVGRREVNETAVTSGHGVMGVTVIAVGDPFL